MYHRALVLLIAAAIMPGALARNIRFKHDPAAPGPTPAPQIQSRQLTRAEIEARAKYPDLFNKRDPHGDGGEVDKRDYAEIVSVVYGFAAGCPPDGTMVYTTTVAGDKPAGVTGTPVRTTTSYQYTYIFNKRALETGVAARAERQAPRDELLDEAEPVGQEANGDVVSDESDEEAIKQQADVAAQVLEQTSRGKQSFMYQGKMVLAPRDAAAFMIGRGVFQWENGSAYTDSAYAQTLELHRRRQEEGNALHKLYNVVVDAMGSKLLEISIPHYKKWTSSLRPDSLYPLSPSTYFAAADVNDLVAELLANPEFEDVQYQHFRVNRRFLEAAYSY